jgi:uncharacterized coiled-coil DUF342 family protein
MEELSIKTMTRSAKGSVNEPGKQVAQKAGLNREILDAAVINRRSHRFNGTPLLIMLLTSVILNKPGKKMNPVTPHRASSPSEHAPLSTPSVAETRQPPSILRTPSSVPPGDSAQASRNSHRHRAQVLRFSDPHPSDGEPPRSGGRGQVRTLHNNPVRLLTRDGVRGAPETGDSNAPAGRTNIPAAYVESLHDEIAILSSRVGSLAKEIKSLEEGKREAWGIIKTLSAKLKQMQDVHGGLIADRDELQERLQDARKEGSDIQAKLDAKTDELIKQVASGNHAHIILSDTIHLQRDEITGLRTMRSGLEANIGDLEQQLDQKSANIDELTESVESLNVDLDALADEVQELNENVSDLESIRTKQQELIAELQSTVKLYHNSNEEIAGMVTAEAMKNVALIEEVKKKDEEISQIKRLNGLLMAKLNERGRSDAGPSQS